MRHVAGLELQSHYFISLVLLGKQISSPIQRQHARPHFTAAMPPSFQAELETLKL